MHQPERVIMANLCMIEDSEGRVVVQERKGHWPGFAFPGGHVEDGESLVGAVIREVREETGLVIRQPRLVGVKDYFQDSGERYLVFMYKASEFDGLLTSSDEGAVQWVPFDDLTKLPLSRGMKASLRVFLDEAVSEMYWPKVGGLEEKPIFQ